jgi:RNase H-fold protein (predicted Holliday junction resolvase)
MQSSPSHPDNSSSGTPQADVGIDPGLVKCGYAVVAASGERLALEIVPTEKLVARLEREVARGSVRMVCLGDATKSDVVFGMIRARWPKLPVTIVDERNTSLEARRRYYEDHPPRGLWRLVPRGLLVPDVPLDGYAALLIVERYRRGLVAKAEKPAG